MDFGMEDFFSGKLDPRDLTPEALDDLRDGIADALANVTEQWLEDTNDARMARSLVMAMRTMSDASIDILSNLDDQPTRTVFGLWVHAYTQILKAYMALEGVTDMKKNFGGKD